MSSIEQTPRIWLVSSETIVFHEHPEQRRTDRLMARIEREKYLRNPPIVADLEDGRYLLLDGANRVSGMKALDYSHIPVQVVNYGDESIQLKGWHHLILQGRSLNLLDSLRALPEVAVEPLAGHEIERHLELRQVFAIFVDETATGWGLFPAAGTDHIDTFKRISILDRIVSAYEGRSDLERIKLADFLNLPNVIRSVEHQLCLFPCLFKEELLELARANVMIPTGITRHLIPGRALGLNLDLHFLEELPNEEAKQTHLKSYLDRLEMEGRVRFYEESVFLMNE